MEFYTFEVFGGNMNKKQKNNLARIIISTLILIILIVLKLPKPWDLITIFIPYLIIGYDILVKAYKGVKNLQPFDENFLMAIATIGAIILGEYTEGMAVMLLYQLGELFQSYAVGKSRKNIGELMDIRPDYAYIEGENGLEQMDPDDIEIGTIIVVRPGERIPIDGILREGEGNLNLVALTGESLPSYVAAGAEVLSGAININGLLKIETTKEFGESTASKILELVENAGSNKSKSEKFISKFARVYTPVVCYSALAIAILPALYRYLIMGVDPIFTQWIYRALVFLVISCPCALVISVPLSFFAGIGGASRAGVLIKGANYIETLSRVKTVVFDKTGTLTKGSFEVEGVHHSQVGDLELLELIALAESNSNHPIAMSIMEAYVNQTETKPDRKRVLSIEEISGRGVKAEIWDKDFVKKIQVVVGNEKLMQEFGSEDYILCTHIGTVVHCLLDGKYSGHVLINDSIKEQSKSAINSLKKIGIKDTIMLTGDIKAVAERVGNDLGLDKVLYQLMPKDKVNKVEELLSEMKDDEKLAFVGDGLNDAPVLSRADVGISMGAIGTDAAIEASDVVLMDDNPKKVATAIKLSQRCMRIVYENIYFAIGIKAACLLLGAVGIANMWLAIIADVGVMVLAVLNAMRALRVKDM